MNFSKLFLIFLIFATINCALALDFEDIKNNTKNQLKKVKIFKKKQPEEKPKMVETKQEWEIEAQDIPLEERELKIEKPEINPKKYHMPEEKYIIEAYNYPPGKRELNIEDVKKNLHYYSYLVADNNFRYVAYSHYYFSPDTNQISSNFFVEKLDTSKSRTKRILEYNHKQQERTPVVESGVKETYPNLFKGLTLVDWSKDSKKVLIKEKIGSTQEGIYKTYLYVHFLENEIESGYTIKLEDFDEAIKHYFIDWENRQIVKYRYDVEPLGFSDENDDMIIAHCYVYDNDGNKIFLGLWGYDCKKRETLLLSKTDAGAKISINGMFIKQVID